MSDLLGNWYIVQFVTPEHEEEEITCYIMKVVPKDENGEEFEEFIPVEDEALEAKLIEVAMTKLESEDDLDDAE